MVASHLIASAVTLDLKQDRTEENSVNGTAVNMDDHSEKRLKLVSVPVFSLTCPTTRSLQNTIVHTI